MKKKEIYTTRKRKIDPEFFAVLGLIGIMSALAFLLVLAMNGLGSSVYPPYVCDTTLIDDCLSQKLDYNEKVSITGSVSLIVIITLVVILYYSATKTIKVKNKREVKNGLSNRKNT